VTKPGIRPAAKVTETLKRVSKNRGNFIKYTYKVLRKKFPIAARARSGKSLIRRGNCFVITGKILSEKRMYIYNINTE
jgi:hypothetical protein